MPPSTRGRAEPAATPSYRSTPAAPKQQQFPGRKRSVKTYGKSRPTPSRSLKQETLTQMDFVGTPGPSFQFSDDDDDDDDDDEYEAEKDSDVEEDPEQTQQLPAPGRDEAENPGPLKSKSKAKSRSSRRKTVGDALDVSDTPQENKRRKTMGDIPSASASSSFHTQTLTQFLSNKDPEEEDWHITDSEAGGDNGLIPETPRKNQSDGQTKELLPKGSTSKPATPIGRTMKTEIPSSQSPLTPMLLRYSPPAPRESPLKRKSSPLQEQTSPILKNTRRTPRGMVVQDTYSTTGGSPATLSVDLRTTPKVTTGKRIRFEIAEDKENITPGRKHPKSPKVNQKVAGRQPLREVPDSDEELDESADEDEIASVREDADRTRDETPCPVAETDRSPVEEPETCYGNLGADTQAELFSSEHRVGFESEEDERPANAPAIPQDRESLGKAKEEAPQCTHAKVLQATKPDLHNGSGKATSTWTKKNNAEPEPMTQFTSFTQRLESQRLPLEVVRELGPQTVRSDIMVSLHPEPLKRILDRTKDHEFRAWKIPPEVSRVWIYATQPHSELRYMCQLGPAKGPGEIVDEKGLGNAEFNRGNKKSANYAYEILEVYELNNPVPLTEMIRKGWIKGAPQKYTFVPPAVVGELTANLRCALFGGDVDSEVIISSPHITESQEIKAQIQSDVDYSTQHQSSDHVHDASSGRAQPPSISKHTIGAEPDDEDVFIRPAVPANLPQSSSMRTPRALFRGQGSHIPTSQATTISQPSSSPALSPGKSQTTISPVRRSQRNIVGGINSSSPVGDYSSLRSSQFRSRSQMLPDSLLNDDTDEPPPIIWDSADEHSE